MKKKLKPSGNGWELYFSKQLLKLLGYNPKETKILITAKNNELYLKPTKNLKKFSDNMVRNFQRSGGSYSLYFPLELIEVLKINPEKDFIELILNGSQLTIKSFLEV